MSKIEIKTFGTMPALALEGWDPNACDVHDHETPRARALYDALGADRDDEKYALARHTDGRWALIGLTESGHEYAEETAAPMARALLDDIGDGETIMGIGETDEDALHEAINISHMGAYEPTTAARYVDASAFALRAWNEGDPEDAIIAGDAVDIDRFAGCTEEKPCNMCGWCRYATASAGSQ